MALTDQAARYVNSAFDVKVSSYRACLSCYPAHIHSDQFVDPCLVGISAFHRVHIPKIYHELVSPRILTMEFMDGSSVTDLKGLQQRGINPQELAKLVSETFNEMIFTFGDVHCESNSALYCLGLLE